MENDENVLRSVSRMKEAFGKAIKEKRVEKRMSYLMFEEKSNISQNHLRNIINGQINLTLLTMVKIALALETPLSELFQRAEEISEGDNEHDR